MQRRHYLRVLLSRLVVVGCLLTLTAPTHAAPPQDGAMPDPDRRAILATLKDKVRTLLREKNEEGVYYQRGSYSKSFHQVDDDTVQVGFHKDTAGKDRLRVERFLLTLERGPGAAGWTITGEELLDTYDGLFRGVPGDEEFHRFESFSFDREGLTVKARNGMLYKNFFSGKVSGITIYTRDQSFDYWPPMDDDQAIYEIIKREKGKKDKLEFEPYAISIGCDPASCEEILAHHFTGLSPASVEDLEPEYRERYDKGQKDRRERRKDHPFSGFTRPWRPDQRFVSLFIHDKPGDRGIGLTYDNERPLEVSYFVRGLGIVFRYWSEETRRGHVSLQNLERREDAEAREYDVKALEGTVELAIEASNLLAADITVDLLIKREVRELPFFLARLRWGGDEKQEIKDPKLTINSIQDAGGNELTHVKTSRFSGLVILPETARAGDTVRLRMQYENEEGIFPLTPSFSAMSRGGWLPFARVGYPIDRINLTVKVPQRYQVLGIGKMTEERVEDGVRITRWVPGFPVDFPTVIFGDYSSATPSKATATRSDGREIPVEIHVDRFSMADWQIGPKALPVLANQAANSLNLYREVYGVDYPYDKLDLVNDPMGFLYGQAPSSIVYLGSGAFKAKGTLGSYGGASMTKFTDSLVAHEVAHQWWGSLIVNASDHHYWFVESLAEYSAALYVEAVYGKDGYWRHVEDWRREILESDLHCSVQDARTQWSGDWGGYRAALYAKGPYFFHMMRSTWGDEVFFRYLKELAQQLAGKSIVTRDIQRVTDEVFEGDMGWFFDQWIRGVGTPEYTMTYSTRETEDGLFLVSGQVEQRLLLGWDKEEMSGRYFVTVLPVTVEGKEGEEYVKKIVLEAPVTRFAFKVPEKPRSVVLNKRGDVLAYDIIVKPGD